MAIACRITARELVKELGGHRNITNVTHCVTSVEYAMISRIYKGLSVKTEYRYELSEIRNVSADYLLKGSESNIEMDDVPNRAAYMKFLAGLSDRELEQTVKHAKITWGMYSVQSPFYQNYPPNTYQIHEVSLPICR